MQDDNDAEKLVQLICEDLFFRDFVARNPKYKKASGRERELADILVLFKDKALVFQVKGVQAPPRSEVDPTVVEGRIASKISDGVRQLKAIGQGLRSGASIEILTGIGQKILLDLEMTRELVGIVVIDLPHEAQAPSADRTRVINLNRPGLAGGSIP